MFSPSLPSETSVALTARYRQLLRPRLTSLRCSRYPETSLGKMNILMSIPAISTTSVFPPLRKVRTSVCCVTSSDLIASVYGFPIFGTGSVRQYRHRSLAYFTVCLTTNQLATCLASGQPVPRIGITPARKGLSPVGTVIFLTYIHHSRHTQPFCKSG